MLCDICGKNPATVHLTEIVNEHMDELHLCEECARQKSMQMEQNFGLSDLLGGLAEFEKPAQEKESSLMKCSSCGLTYQDFKKIGRLGCSDCYQSFHRLLGPLLKRIHGSSQHLGKTPVKLSKGVRKKADSAEPGFAEPSSVELKQKLQQAIKHEEFEEAARLRDQIKELEKKNEH